MSTPVLLGLSPRLRVSVRQSSFAVLALALGPKIKVEYSQLLNPLPPLIPPSHSFFSDSTLLYL